MHKFLHLLCNKQLRNIVSIAKILVESEHRKRYIYLDKDNIYRLSTTKPKKQDFVGYVAKHYDGKIHYFENYR